MATVSLCMIVRNEEDVLERCLDSVKGIVDEIIIADTGSTDATREIALHCGATVYSFTWDDNFSKARNFAFSKAQCDYQMWLDADDVIEEDSRKKLIALKDKLTADVVMLPYCTAFDSNGKPVFSFYRERLLKRSVGFRWEGAVHECITPKGNILYSDASVCHRKIKNGDSLRNLRIYQKLKGSGHSFTSRELYYYGRELTEHRAYKAAAEVFGEYLERDDVWRPDCREACLLTAFCHKQLGNMKDSLRSAVRALEYGVPTPELCCFIGDLYLENSEYNTSIYWYKSALEAGRLTEKNSGFVRSEYAELIPSLQLCLCYDRLGQLNKAYEWHRRAYSQSPDHPSCKYNEEYFKNKQLNTSCGKE